MSDLFRRGPTDGESLLTQISQVTGMSVRVLSSSLLSIMRIVNETCQAGRRVGPEPKSGT